MSQMEQEMYVSDYGPLDPEFAEDRLGITIFMDNGDILLYFPEVKECEEA